MRITRRDSLETAEIVLALVEDILANSQDDLTRVYLECYSNGREHGYAIGTLMTKIAIAFRAPWTLAANLTAEAPGEYGGMSGSLVTILSFVIVVMELLH